MSQVRMRRPLIALIVLIAALLIGYVVQAMTKDNNPSSPPTTSAATTGGSSNGNRSSTGNSSSTANGLVALSTLPAQAADTVRLIKAGGPFPFSDNDGVVFHNYEHVLPAESDGYYHEYTVITPGSSTRGARRIITGKGGEFYYTGDHYAHFVRVDINR